MGWLTSHEENLSLNEKSQFLISDCRHLWPLGLEAAHLKYPQFDSGFDAGPCKRIRKEEVSVTVRI